MFASRWHSPPKPGLGVELDHRDVHGGDPVGVHAALHVALEHADADAVEPGEDRSSSDVLPAPGALIRLTTATPA